MDGSGSVFLCQSGLPFKAIDRCSARMQNTYEESLINVANKKGGLNEAILGNLASSNAEDPHENAAMISRLLKEGAHSLLGGKCAPFPAAFNGVLNRIEKQNTDHFVSPLYAIFCRR
jgi:hypothetical protein